MTGRRAALSVLGAQAMRSAFYAAQSAVSMRFSRAGLTPEQRAYRPQGPLPGKAAFRQAMLELIARDLANIRAGIYPRDVADRLSPRKSFAATRAFFADLPAVIERRRRSEGAEVRNLAESDGYPPYYLQNFHYQSGGWLSEESAALYDHQVEVLFTGLADTMRRQGLVPLKRQFGAQLRPRPRLLDVGAGTGRFLKHLRRTLPMARLTAVEPSPAYRQRALDAVPGARILEGFAESLPLADGSVDGVSAVFLFHELPPKVRAAAAAEIARALAPSGMFVMVDSLQYGDREGFDGLLEAFPHRFHEPYFASYLETDFEALFSKHGIRLASREPAFLSKVLVFEKAAGV